MKRWTFGELLRHCREAQGLSQGQIADKLGIRPPYICNLEKGKQHGSVSVAQALRIAYACDFDDLSFVQAALQSQLDAAGVKFTVNLTRDEAERGQKR